VYVRETWSFTLKEKHRLRVPEKRVLRRIFELTKKVERGEWRKFHNEELHNLYSVVNMSWVSR
jgi:hypothetical protein